MLYITTIERQVTRINNSRDMGGRAIHTYLNVRLCALRGRTRPSFESFSMIREHCKNFGVKIFECVRQQLPPVVGVVQASRSCTLGANQTYSFPTVLGEPQFLKYSTFTSTLDRQPSAPYHVPRTWAERFLIV